MCCESSKSAINLTLLEPPKKINSSNIVLYPAVQKLTMTLPCMDQVKSH